MSPCYPKRFIIIQALLLYTFVVREATPTSIKHRRASDSYQSLPQNQGLYNSSDDVVVLNSENFKSSVYGSKNAWLLEFYNSWCGYCQRFAPVWKSLANDIRTWRDVVTVAALDCADDDNNPLCREYEIMRYPEVRYFAPGRQVTNGVDVEKAGDVDTLRRNLVLRLRKEQQEGRGSEWPNMTPFRSSEVKDMWEGAPASAKYFLFLFEEVNSTLGAEVTLDFRRVSSLVIRSVTSDNGPLCLVHRITRFPSLVVYGRNGTQERLAIRVPTRRGTRKVLEDFASTRGIDTSALDYVPENSSKPTLATTPQRAIEDENNSSTTSAREEKETSKDALYRADLEATLKYALTHEIPTRRIIDGERMNALKKFTSALASYFPIDGGNPMFLSTINLVVKSKESMSGEEFSALVTSTEQEMSPVFTERNAWIGCRPSRHGFRGYPCGLWTLFHTLTVNFAEREEERANPTRVLEAMHGYIEQFFGCADCSRHFVKMAAKNNMLGVTSADEGVLWLWRAHNEVNARLAGDDTEDPAHKKIQYPSVEHCPSCRESVNGSWNASEVLAYLKRKYSRPLSVEARARSSSTEKNDTGSQPRRERLASVDMQAKRFRWDFTVFDISICVVLYVASAAILMLVCIKFAVKRSYKKRMYVQSILGKV